jgi:hypothetical protein
MQGHTEHGIVLGLQVPLDHNLACQGICCVGGYIADSIVLVFVGLAEHCARRHEHEKLTTLQCLQRGGAIIKGVCSAIWYGTTSSDADRCCQHSLDICWDVAAGHPRPAATIPYCFHL